MGRVAEHYEQLLARHYSWMIGMTFEAKVAEQRKVLEDCGIPRGAKGLVVDLGSGPGFQSVALAGMGFRRVMAIDTSQTLLDELSTYTGNLPVETVRADLRGFPSLLGSDLADVIVCMGDTLTHLEDRNDISKLFEDVYAALAPDGVFVLTFRDLSLELSGLDRILPVRADDDRIMLCILDYEPDTVVVNDVIYVRNEKGWSLHKSSYRKLRLAPAAVASQLVALGFTVARNETAGGMHLAVAQKASG